MKYYLLLALTLLFYSEALIAQSPWAREKEGVYIQSSYSIIPAYNSLFTENGNDFITSRTINHQTIQAYIEYGIGHHIEIAMSLPYKIISSSGPSDNPSLSSMPDKGMLSAPGNGSVNIKYQFLEKNYQAAFSVSGSFPTSFYQPETGLSSGYNAYGVTPVLSLGKSWKKTYIYSYSGFSFRNNGYSNLFKAGIEIGHRIIKKGYLMAYSDIIDSQQNAKANLPANQLSTGMYVNDEEYFSWGIKSIYQAWEEIGFIAGFAGSFSGNMVAHSPYIMTGIYWEP